MSTPSSEFNQQNSYGWNRYIPNPETLRKHLKDENFSLSAFKKEIRYKPSDAFDLSTKVTYSCVDAGVKKDVKSDEKK